MSSLHFRLKKKTKEEIVKETVNEVVSSLDIEWKTVISLRYGLDGGGPRTVEEVAELLGTTKEAVLNLEHDALRSLYTRPAERK